MADGVVASPVKLAVIGCGRWGPNHIRAFQELDEAVVAACCDKDADATLRCAQRFNIRGYDDIGTMLDREDLDAVVVATPVLSHHPIVIAALERGVDVLCEKPLDVDPALAEAMHSNAKANDRILMVGHIFLYNAGIVYLRELLQSGALGNLSYIYCRRTNLGPVRYDVGALADLATHDISICNYLVDEWSPKVATSFRGALQENDLEDVAFATLRYRWGRFAHLHVSWVDPVKVRQVVVVGDEKMAAWDDLRQEGPVAIYDKRLERSEDTFELGSLHAFRMAEKHGAVTIPSVRGEEPLKAEARAFVKAVQTRETPRASAAGGVAVAETLAALRSNA